MKNNQQVLSGAWCLAKDPENKGTEEKWYESNIVEESELAPVPGLIQQVFPDYHGVAWYWHRFVPRVPFASEHQQFLKFEFVDYYAEIWLNGIYIGSHEGGEMPFEFDVTDHLIRCRENLLAIRILNPIDLEIDGIIQKQTPNRHKSTREVSPGTGFNFGGIYSDIHLVELPQVRISNLFVRPNMVTGEINIRVTVANGTSIPVNSRINIDVSSSESGEVLLSSNGDYDFATGESVFETVLTIDKPRLWSLEVPYLYRVNVTLDSKWSDRIQTHHSSVRCGFRDFRVEKGFFRLNGKRIFVRSTHTGNHYPVGTAVAITDPYLVRQDLIYAKASGFNMIRFIATAPLQEQLDFCDEIGLMVYNECAASWGMEDSPMMKERFNNSTLGLVRRDRNHPCVVIWGLLNETMDDPIFRHAASILPQLRAVDDTRLVLLGSGRWDRQLGIGTICNPGDVNWQFEWGAEEYGAAEIPNRSPFTWEWGYPTGLYEGMGDAHFYPVEPRTGPINELVRTLGQETKPVFLSEWGYGSLLDVIRATRYFEQYGARSDLHDVALFRRMADRFESEWNRLGMQEVYAFPQHMLEDSSRIHSRQRRRVFDHVRSNPRFCGYNLTGMLDHGYSGEGLWTFFREWKPGVIEALQDGWSPLRWCLFVEPMHVYAGTPFQVEAVLANEDVLLPGEYPVCFRISGKSGVVWEKRAKVSISETESGEDGPLAIPVILEQVVLDDVKAGEYELSAFMEYGGAPSGGRLRFNVAYNQSYRVLRSEPISVIGLDSTAEYWLNKKGIQIKPLTDRIIEHDGLIIVGGFSGEELTSATWDLLMKKAEAGSTVIFLSPHVWKRGEDSMGWFPFTNKGRCYKFIDWLYHKDCVAKEHLYFEGLQSKGIMDIDYYGQVIPDYIFDGQDTPDEVMAASFAVGYPCETGVATGVLLGSYALGAGRIVLNSFRIMANLGVNPTADMLLMNMIAYEQSRTAPISEKMEV
ncbi:sugar-binding domain-containing protein [Paenibacillus sp. OV219]|uniref:sugar-binding domain-containing protein n=1 Tax=Paenibacillus sp. OV219 TaxID=1884377 RepID=UPI0008D59C92|nr:sugar-binding domain-containing protein [Paenibacillus sp. OV219]SEN98391.1 Glycosyl hydrolases family 2 [Paenibacillus sp. OV219]